MNVHCPWMWQRIQIFRKVIKLYPKRWNKSQIDHFSNTNFWLRNFYFFDRFTFLWKENLILGQVRSTSKKQTPAFNRYNVRKKNCFMFSIREAIIRTQTKVHWLYILFYLCYALTSWSTRLSNNWVGILSKNLKSWAKSC